MLAGQQQQTSADESYACHKLLEALPSTSPEQEVCCIVLAVVSLLYPRVTCISVDGMCGSIHQP